MVLGPASGAVCGISDMTFVLGDDLSQGRGGNYLLFLSISHFDPKNGHAQTQI
jgi:hypothetical protein